MEKLGTILPYCKIQVIDEKTMKWVTLATCIDAPGIIQKKVDKLNKYHKNLWVNHCYGKEPLF
jgi:hypothetical protein